MRLLPIAAALFAVSALPALAIPIATGSNVDFSSGVDPIGGANVYNSTGVDFRTSGLASPGTPGTVNINNTLVGSFAAFNAFTCPPAQLGGCGTIADLLTYTPNSSTLSNPTLPVFSFLTVTQGGLTMTFDLTSFSNTELAPTGQQLGTLILSGVGILHFTGFDATPGVMTITAQGDGNTSFSGSVVAVSAVAEPASLALLGFGLAGLIAARRRPSTQEK